MMTKPCNKCPFSTKTDGFLREGRVFEIIDSLERGGRFPCHQTLEYLEDENGEDVASPSEGKWCAGALVFMEKYYEDQGGAHVNQMVRIAARIGMLDLDKLDPTSPVFDDDDTMATHHENGAKGYEH